MSSFGFERESMISDALVDHLHANGVVAYPTSTLPGLACLPTKEALDALYALKQRPADKPVSLGVLSLDQAATLVDVPEKVRRLEAAFPKGGFSFVLDARTPLDPRLGSARVAVRCLAHPVARALVETVGPITATSANESGETPAASADEAGRGLGLPHHAILPGACPGGKGSTFVNVTANEHEVEVTVMREGVVPSDSVVEWWKSHT
jgi:L-threonylcarbamoyladenylate synthase